jgi:hypothetical protein
MKATILAPSAQQTQNSAVFCFSLTSSSSPSSLSAFFKAACVIGMSERDDAFIRLQISSATISVAALAKKYVAKLPADTFPIADWLLKLAVRLADWVRHFHGPGLVGVSI